jgi:FtsH-binding integral membrane protein
MAYFCAENSNRLVFFGLMLMTAISVAFELYAVCSSNYMQTLSAIVFILGCTLIILQSFIIWTTVDIVYIGLVYVPIIIFGFYLNYDIRRMVRGSLYDNQKEDPVTGAVRIWLETTFVFCRMVELAGGMCIKDKH